MRLALLLFYLIFIVGAFSPILVYAAEILDIPNGITKIELNNDGQQETIIRAWRENFNAHGFSVISIFLQSKEKIKSVPFFEKEKESQTVQTIEGADCILTDYKIYKDANLTYFLKAEREFGNNYNDTKPVLFTLLKMVKNESGEIGMPPLSIVVDKKWISQKTYCDVDEAVKAEIK